MQESDFKDHDMALYHKSWPLSQKSIVLEEKYKIDISSDKGEIHPDKCL